MPKPTILLVDDVNLIIELEKSFLKHLPVRLCTARNGAEALEVARQERPDLIYMDLNMPVMDGPTCCATLKADPELRSIPVVMVTTAGREGDEELCRQSGCDDYLTKPIDRQLFLEKGRNFLVDFERRQQRVECRTTVEFRQEEGRGSGTGTDISVGGIYVASPERVEPANPVDLSFSLAGEGPITARGRVAWENSAGERRKPHYPAGFGVEFTDIDPDAVSFIQAFIDGTKLKL